MKETLPIHFAPLQGYTDAPYRNAHAAFFGGVDTYYTPFVRVEKGTFRHREVRDIEPENNEVPHLIPQLISPEVDKAEAILALFIEKGYNEVDINLGCPFPILAKRHNGSGILPYPDEVKALLAVVTNHPEIQFSVKMRLGWGNADECLVLAPILNDLPLKQITLHARLGQQQYKGDVNQEGFAAFYDACKHPLIYNGDILQMEDIHHIVASFPRLAGVMIGRGLLANPALALEYKENRTLSPDEMKKKLLALHSALFAHYEKRMEGGEGQLLAKMKTFWEYLMPDGDRKAKKTIHKTTSLSKYLQAASLLLANR